MTTIEYIDGPSNDAGCRGGSQFMALNVRVICGYSIQHVILGCPGVLDPQHVMIQVQGRFSLVHFHGFFGPIEYLPQVQQLPVPSSCVTTFVYCLGRNSIRDMTTLETR